MTDTSTIVFGRLPSPDARDARYPMRALLPPQIPLVSKFYTTGPTLDQEKTPQCVGYAWRQFLTSAPVETLDGPTAPEIYHQAQLNDEWPGEAYSGTSVRGAATALTTDARLKSYVWGTSAAEVRDFLITTSTVVMGTDWLNNMFTPTANGVLKVSGGKAGGHAYLLCGYDVKTNYFQMMNSWGESWGQHGKAWMRFSDLDKLLKNGGEACAAVELEIVPVATLESVAADLVKLQARVSALEKP